jgi:hypothetical protein
MIRHNIRDDCEVSRADAAGIDGLDTEVFGHEDPGPIHRNET